MSALTARSAGSGVLLAAALGLALLLIGPGGPGCGFGELNAMPPALLGKWTTSHPRYRGRAIEIRPRRVVLAELGRPIDRYQIESIHHRTAKEGTIYELRCITDDGIPDTLRLTLVRASPPYLELGEMPAHWTRSGKGRPSQ
jgi:hypothetical protein